MLSGLWKPLRLLILSIQYAPEFTSNAIVVTGLAQQLGAVIR